VQINAAGQVVLKLKTPWRDGTMHLVMSPPEFLQKQVALAPFLRRPALGCSRDASSERPLRGDHSKVVSVGEGSLAAGHERRLSGRSTWGQLSGGEIAHPAVAGRPNPARQASPKLPYAWTGLVRVWRLRTSRS
jgi:hypothetical protein